MLKLVSIELVMDREAWHAAIHRARTLEAGKRWARLAQARAASRSCLENPRDGGAWWAAVYGVAIPTLKPSTTQGPTRSRERHNKQILQQHRNTTKLQAP